MTAQVIEDPRHPAHAIARATAALASVTLVCKAPGFLPRRLSPEDFMSALECLHPHDWARLSERLAYDILNGMRITFPDGEAVWAEQE